MEGDVITLQDIFPFDFGMGIDEDGRFRGRLKSTGIRPKFAEKLADYGIALEPSLFADASRSATGQRVDDRAAAAIVLAAIDRQPGEARLRAAHRRAACSGSASRVVLMSGDRRGKIERRLGDLMQEPTPDDEDEDEAFVPRATRRSPRPR